MSLHNAASDTFQFSKPVRTSLLVFAILMMVLVVTIPVGLYILWRRSAAKLTFDREGFHLAGLGLPSRWTYADLTRVGLLSIDVRGGGAGGALGHGMNGGQVAVNLCGLTKSGKTLKFMVSRFENQDDILRRVVEGSGLPLETVQLGVFGPKWPDQTTLSAPSHS